MSTMNITDSNIGNTSITSNSNNDNKEYRYTSVRITQECKAKLQQIGRLGETYSDVIDRLASQRLTFERIPGGQEVAIR